VAGQVAGPVAERGRDTVPVTGQDSLAGPGSGVAEWVTAGSLASGFAAVLDLDERGMPARPLVFADLTAAECDPSLLRAAAAQVRSALPLVVGVADGPMTAPQRAFADAATLTLARDADGTKAAVVVADVAAAAEALQAAVAGAPGAAIALGHLLRQTEQLDTRSALAAEAAVYSMLLSGPEFHRWLRRRGLRRPDAAARPAQRPGPPVVSVQREGDMLHVMLQRQHRRNALNAEVREALAEALSVAVADPALTVELSGAGPDFCSGGDLDEFGTATDLVAAYLVRLARHPGWLMHLLRDRARVAVHGACIGAGIEIPAFAARIVAARGSYFGLPEVGMGLVPGAGGTVSISRRVGRWRTAWMALTGARVDAVTALGWGLIDEIAS
jgi:enoyl-CoA hydratase/carnithine racemase